MVVLITGSNNGMNDCSDHRSELKDAEMTIMAAAVQKEWG